MKFKMSFILLFISMILFISGCSSCSSEKNKESEKQTEITIEQQEKNKPKSNEESLNKETETTNISETEKSTEPTKESEWTETYEDSDPQMVLCGKDPKYFTGTNVIRCELFWEIEASEVEGDFETEGEETFKFENINNPKDLIGRYIQDLMAKGYLLTFNKNDIRIYEGDRASVEFNIESDSSFTFTVKSLI